MLIRSFSTTATSTPRWIDNVRIGTFSFALYFLLLFDADPSYRAHRIGQIRDVHIYRFVSQHTVEEAMLRKANQKRSMDDLVIQKGEFDWRSLFNDENALTKALGDFEDAEDRHAAAVAAREEISLVGADEDDFGEGEAVESITPADGTTMLDEDLAAAEAGGIDDEDQEEAGGTVVDYMLAFVEDDYDFFRDWRL